MKIFFALIAVVALFTGCTQERVQTPQFGTGTLVVHGAEFFVEVADTESERERGLQNRASLAANTGMVFVFPQQGTQEFWMKNTLMALDLLWIADGKVVDISADVQPEPAVSDSQLKRYAAHSPIDAVLELPAGTAASIGILVGDSVVLQEP